MLDVNYGLCKLSVVVGIGFGGFKWDIVFGDVDNLILVYWMYVMDLVVRMLELGCSVVYG